MYEKIKELLIREIEELHKKFLACTDTKDMIDCVMAISRLIDALSKTDTCYKD